MTSPFSLHTRLRTSVGFQKDARAPILRREDEKYKRYDARLATIGPGLKLLAFGLNHVGVLGDDANKVIAEQGYSARSSRVILAWHRKTHPSYPTFRLPFIPLMPFLLMSENAILIL